MSSQNETLPIADSWGRRLARFILTPQRFYPIPFGPLRGLRLEYSSLTQLHFLLGLYDLKMIRTTERVLRNLGILKDGFVACDLGANIGYFTLWMAKMGRSFKNSQVFSFEPNEKNADQVRRNTRMNDFTNVRILEKAVADKNGVITFYEGQSTASGSLVERWARGDAREKDLIKTDVQSTTLDTFFETGEGNGRTPSFLKIDIEGAGETALAKMKKTISKARPVILMESHLPGEDRAISQLILELGYEAYRFNTSQWVVSREKIYPDPNGIWGTMLLIPSELKKQTQI